MGFCQENLQEIIKTRIFKEGHITALVYLPIYAIWEDVMPKIQNHINLPLFLKVTCVSLRIFDISVCLQKIILT